MPSSLNTNAHAATLRTLEDTSTLLKVPCHDGEMPFRRWPRLTDPPSEPSEEIRTVLLVHGGSGSWSHWFRNISALREHCHVLAVDLPGLGDSAALPEGYTAEDAVDVFVRGTREVTEAEALHIVAFSWGCAISSQAAVFLEDRLESLLLVGPSSLGDIPRRGGMKPLIRRTPEMSPDEIHAANRENVARLMIHDRTRIDDLAVHIQTTNTQRARFNSPQFARSRLVLDGVARTRVPLKVVYGEFDAPAMPDVVGKEALFRAERADVEFEVVADAGHWLQYERPDVFNELTLEWIARNTG